MIPEVIRVSKCFFIGHRNTPEEIRPLLLKSIDRHIAEYGVTEFYVGQYGAFDSMAADALCETKKSYPHIKNYLLLAYHPAIRAVKKPEGFDDTILLDGQETVPPRVAVTRLNRKMIREADYLIAYVRYITNGSYKLLEVAKASAVKGQIVITNLAELLGGVLH